VNALLWRFRREHDGIAATEFAMIAPILLLLLMASVEFPRALGMSQNVTRAARTVADLVARGGGADMDDVYAAAAAVAAPYDISGADLVITAAGVYKNGTALSAKVCSAYARKGTAKKAGVALGEAPPAFAKDKARYLIVEMSVRYPVIFSAFPYSRDITFERSIRWPVRQGDSVNGEAEIVLPGGNACPKA